MLYEDFRWRGVLASTMGVVVTEQVGYSRPAEKVDQVQIPGRAGMLTLATGSSWEPVTYAPVCALKPGADRERVFAWLRGSGEVIFGSMPGFGFEARLMNQIDFRQVFEAVGAYGTFSPVFSCQPLRRQVPQEGKIVCTNGMKLTNPGNVASRPKISVFCTGSVTLSLAGQAVHLKGQTGGSVLDCEAEDCYSGDFLSLANQLMTGEFPTIPVGTSYINWEAGAGSSVTKVEIEPRWRWL